ncbi:MAG: hypothetical protein HYS15_00640 [Candidatus Spechtbacteria bacterium]|nr:hypothetical protein [Candidatus Spechtbacteria bacterium]
MNLESLVRKIATPLAAALAVEIVGVVFLMVGILPKEAAFFLAGILAFFVIFAPLKSAVLFAVFSIPLYTALPITESFDSMASWRIIVAILFLRVLLRSPWAGKYPRIPLTRLSIVVGLFFIFGALSLLVAREPMFGVKKLAYLANIFSLFFVIQATIKNKDDFIAVLKYALGGFIVTLAAGYAQFTAVLFAPLYSFWLWWAAHVIPVFYGADLGRLLTHANTWFSYYKNGEPTLRIFSVFPDSHSFALYMVLILPILSIFLLKFKRAPSRALGGTLFNISALAGIAVLVLLAIIFSGTRGVWIGAVPSFLFVLISFLFLKLHVKKIERIVKILRETRERFATVLYIGLV